LFQRYLAMSTRTFCSNNIPVSKRRRYSDEDRFYWPARMLNQQMRHMDRMFDEYVPSSVQQWWNRPSWINNYSMVRPEKDIKVEYNDKHFSIKLDVADYNPEDLSVKVSGDRLFISGKHSEKKDKYGYISQEFTRHFVIPDDVDPDSIDSSYNGEELILHGTVKGGDNIQERTIEIKQQAREQQSGEQKSGEQKSGEQQIEK